MVTPDQATGRPRRGAITLLCWAAALLALMPPTATVASPGASPGEVTEPSFSSTRGPKTGGFGGGEVSASGSLAALVGKVRDQQHPLAAAGVYAYRLADLSLRKAITDQRGDFSFSALPAGLYKIIAHKPGFLPAVVLLTRDAATTFQELEVELRPETFEAGTEQGDFWTIRERIPPDVLREIAIANAYHEDTGQEPATSNDFAAEIAAFRGLGGFGRVVDAEMHGGAVDLQGQLGRLVIGLEGSFRELSAATAAATDDIGSVQRVALTLASPSTSRVAFSSQQARLSDGGAPVDLEQFGLSWSSDIGPGRSELRAEYLEEANFFGDPLEPIATSSASRTWQLEGSYEAQVGERSSLQTGIRYHQRQGYLPYGLRLPIDRQRFDFFGQGDHQIQSSLLVRYGLYSTVHENGVRVAPQGGLIVELSPKWSAETSLRHRFDDESVDFFDDFVPAFYSVSADCTTAESDCYVLRFTRELGDDNSLTVSAIHREFGDTLRLYFSDDFFDHLESVVFVRGDRLPELQFSLRHDLAPSVSTHFRSSFAEGGGGSFSGYDFRFENAVRYLVTSLDTHFDATDTGVLLAFQRVEQEFEPLGAQEATVQGDLEMDRFQVLVTQELRSLLGLSSDWALRLDMQLSRGTDPLLDADDDLRRRIVGGIAVRF